MTAIDMHRTCSPARNPALARLVPVHTPAETNRRHP
jgi:hypothetical protein